MSRVNLKPSDLVFAQAFVRTGDLEAAAAAAQVKAWAVARKMADDHSPLRKKVMELLEYRKITADLFDNSVVRQQVIAILLDANIAASVRVSAARLLLTEAVETPQDFESGLNALINAIKPQKALDKSQ